MVRGDIHQKVETTNDQVAKNIIFLWEICNEQQSKHRETDASPNSLELVCVSLSTVSHPAYISVLESFKSSLNQEWKVCSFLSKGDCTRVAWPGCCEPDVTSAEIATSAGRESRPELQRDGFAFAPSTPRQPCRRFLAVLEAKAFHGASRASSSRKGWSRGQG